MIEQFERSVLLSISIDGKYTCAVIYLYESSRGLLFRPLTCGPFYNDWCNIPLCSTASPYPTHT